MPTLLTILLVLGAVAIALVLALAFWLTGGFDRLAAERAVAGRGLVAERALVVPGLLSVALPGGWAPDQSTLHRPAAPGGVATNYQGDPAGSFALG